MHVRAPATIGSRCRQEEEESEPCIFLFILLREVEKHGQTTPCPRNAGRSWSGGSTFARKSCLSYSSFTSACRTPHGSNHRCTRKYQQRSATKADMQGFSAWTICSVVARPFHPHIEPRDRANRAKAARFITNLNTTCTSSSLGASSMFLPPLPRRRPSLQQWYTAALFELIVVSRSCVLANSAHPPQMIRFISFGPLCSIDKKYSFLVPRSLVLSLRFQVSHSSFRYSLRFGPPVLLSTNALLRAGEISRAYTNGRRSEVCARLRPARLSCLGRHVHLGRKARKLCARSFTQFSPPIHPENRRPP